MPKTKIAGIGMYVPKNILKNDDLKKYMDTNDEWIRANTGIKERRYADRDNETTTTMGIEAAKQATENAGITPQDIDFIIFATLSPDYCFPGCGVLVQRVMGMKEIGALDVRNQCSGFIYSLSVGDQFIKSGMYKNILVIGSEKHSHALDFSTEGRKVTVMFGDGAGAVVLQPTENEKEAILSTHLHSDGSGAEQNAALNPGTHSNFWLKGAADYDKADWGSQNVSHTMIDKGQLHVVMNGSAIMKKAVIKIPEVINEALDVNNKSIDDVDMLILNQSNLRVAEFIQKKMGLSDDRVHTNIQHYGNTTAASIPIALFEAAEQGKIKKGDLICIASYGSGLTWASALFYW